MAREEGNQPAHDDPPARTVGELLQLLKQFPADALLEIEGKKHNSVSASLITFTGCSVCMLEGTRGDSD